MSLETIRASLVSALADVDALLIPPAPPGPPTIQVTQADNLRSLVTDAMDGTTFVCDPTATFDIGQWTISKPVTIRTAVLVGNITTAAPVRLETCGLSLGSQPQIAAIDAGAGTTIDDCQIVAPAGGKRGILVNAADITIRRTRVTGFRHIEDSQAIGGARGTRNLLVEDCYLEASGENVLFGGDRCYGEANIPQDITFRRCHLYKPMEWRTAASTTCKNLFELKNAKRVLVEDCTMENSYVDGQTGFALVLTVRNQYGDDPYATIEDAIFRNNIFTGMSSAVQILGNDNNWPSQMASRIALEGNTFDNINPAVYGGSGRQIQIDRGIDDLTLRNNTFTVIGTVCNSFLYMSSPLVGGVPTMPLNRLVVEGNTFVEGSHGIFGASSPGHGTSALGFFAPGWVFAGNTVNRTFDPGRTISYPTGTVVNRLF